MQMDQVQGWCEANNMSVSAGKTVFTVLGAHEEVAEMLSAGVTLTVGNQKLEYDPTPTFLGLKLDPQLNMSAHANALLQR